MEVASSSCKLPQGYPQGSDFFPSKMPPVGMVSVGAGLTASNIAHGFARFILCDVFMQDSRQAEPARLLANEFDPLSPRSSVAISRKPTPHQQGNSDLPGTATAIACEVTPPNPRTGNTPIAKMSGRFSECQHGLHPFPSRASDGIPGCVHDASAASLRHIGFVNPFAIIDGPPMRGPMTVHSCPRPSSRPDRDGKPSAVAPSCKALPIANQAAEVEEAPL